MAIYRNIQMSFWTDTKVMDDFTPRDKFFYLYLMTNPHTNLSGCYEISIRQMSDETGYSKDVVEKVLKQITTVHKVASYSSETKEMLILNWSRYNWTSSEKFRKPLLKEINKIKNTDFKAYLLDLYDGKDTVSIPYEYPIDTTCIDTTVTVTDTDINNNTSNTVNKYIYFPNDEVMDKYFTDYAEYRKEIKHPLTARSLKMQVKKLTELATINGAFDRNIAIKIIERTIANGWQGLFPLDDKKVTEKPQTQPKPNTNKFGKGMESRVYDYAKLEEEAFGGKP